MFMALLFCPGYALSRCSLWRRGARSCCQALALQAFSGISTNGNIHPFAQWPFLHLPLPCTLTSTNLSLFPTILSPPLPLPPHLCSCPIMPLSPPNPSFPYLTPTPTPSPTPPR